MGSLPAPVTRELRAALAKGVAVVLSSRLPEGFVPAESADTDEEETGDAPFVASGALSPLKARILLQCVLAQETPAARLPQLFRQAAHLS